MEWSSAGGATGACKFVRPYRNIGELNPTEQLKLARHPFEVAQAVIDTYSKQGPDSIAKVPGEVERLKWVGMYPQRQGGDAFMMRIKVPGGVMTAPQVREIGVAADAFAEGPDDSPVFGNRYADLTTRQDIQLHWIRIADVPRIWQRFWDVGLTTVQACGDSARNVCSCPVSGIDQREVVDALPVAQAISAFFTGNREYANLPRKFKIAVTGCTEDCARVEINDIGLWPAEQADGTVGFNVLIGGGLSDGERMASDIDLFIRPDQAVELSRGVAQVFGELGNRENRGLARMRYLAQELGPGGVPRGIGRAHELRARARRTGADDGLPRRPRRRAPPEAARPPLRRLLGPGRADARYGTRGAGPAGRDLRRRRRPHRHRPELHCVRRARGPARRPAGRAADADLLAVPGALRARRRGLHRLGVLPVRRGRDQGARRQVGTGPGRPAGRGRGRRAPGRGGDPHALLGLLGVVCPAADRGHRLPGRHRPRGRAHRRGGRHRLGGLARARRSVHRLARRRGAGRPGS